MLRNFVLMLMICSSSPALAETVFIQDLIFVPLRGGPSEEYRIIHRGIPSGTELELIRSEEDSNFSMVRLKDGTEGWLKDQYISSEPIARDKLLESTAKMEALQSEIQQLGSSADEFEAIAARLQAENNSLIQQASELQREFDTLTNLSANTIKINDKNSQLKLRNRLLMDELDTLSQMNAQLTDTRDQQWFLIGAATLLLGMIPGFLFARRIYSRRSTGWAD